MLRHALRLALVIAGALIGAAVPLFAAGEAVYPEVAAAIERAVVEQVGATSATVVVARSTVTSAPAMTAASEPGARTGKAMRFVLSSRGKRVGTAVATVDVVAAHVVSSRAIARDDEISAGDVHVVEGPVKDLPLRRLPALADVVGARPRRAVAAGEVMTAALVTVPPVVRSGDELTVTVTSGAVQVSGTGRASGSGHVGDEIRVTRPGSRQVLRARITGPGEVEIVQ